MPCTDFSVYNRFFSVEPKPINNCLPEAPEFEDMRILDEKQGGRPFDTVEDLTFQGKTIVGVADSDEPESLVHPILSNCVLTGCELRELFLLNCVLRDCKVYDCVMVRGCLGEGTTVEESVLACADVAHKAKLSECSLTHVELDGGKVEVYNCSGYHCQVLECQITGGEDTCFLDSMVMEKYVEVAAEDNLTFSSVFQKKEE